MIENRDARILTIAILNEQSERGYVKSSIIFDDWRKATEIRDFFIEERRAQQIAYEKQVIERFLGECEEEVKNW